MPTMTPTNTAEPMALMKKISAARTRSMTPEASSQPRADCALAVVEREPDQGDPSSRR